MSALLIATVEQLCWPDHQGDPAKIAAWTANKTPEAVARWISGGRARLILAMQGSALAGIGAYVPDGEILLVYVSAQHRYQGVSSAVLAQIEQSLAACGVREARLISSRTAETFYRARGWRDAGAPEFEFGMPGQPMVKALCA